jgi:hypothetical protein
LSSDGSLSGIFFHMGDDSGVDAVRESPKR